MSRRKKTGGRRSRTLGGSSPTMGGSQRLAWTRTHDNPDCRLAERACARSREPGEEGVTRGAVGSGTGGRRIRTREVQVPARVGRCN